MLGLAPKTSPKVGMPVWEQLFAVLRSLPVGLADRAANRPRIASRRVARPRLPLGKPCATVHVRGLHCRPSAGILNPGFRETYVKWSGRGSNPRPRACKARALPTELPPQEPCPSTPIASRRWQAASSHGGNKSDVSLGNLYFYRITAGSARGRGKRPTLRGTPGTPTRAIPQDTGFGPLGAFLPPTR